MKKNIDKNGFLKQENALFATNIVSLALNLGAIIGILVAIALDKSKAVPYDAVLKTAGISLGAGAVGVAGAITTGVVEGRLEKKKAKTPSKQVLDMTDDIKKPDEDGESKEFLKELGKLSQENGYEYSAE